MCIAHQGPENKQRGVLKWASVASVVLINDTFDHLGCVNTLIGHHLKLLFIEDKEKAVEISFWRWSWSVNIINLDLSWYSKKAFYI